MAETIQISISDLINQAIDSMPDVQRLRKRVWKSLLANRPRLRMEVCDQVAVAICDEPCCSVHMVAALNAEGFHADSMLAINPDNLTKLLEAILKYLPAILALFFRV